MKKLLWFVVAGAGLFVLTAQDIKINIINGQRPAMAVPDFRGSGAAQGLMGTFNQTLWSDLDSAGLFKMVPKTSYPTTIPQQPSDFREPPAPSTRSRSRAETAPPSGGGLWMTDWSGPPVSANYLAFGYTAVQNDELVL